MEAAEVRAAEVTGKAFWSGFESRVLAPPRLAEEGEAIEALLAGEGKVVFASSGSGGTPKWTAFRREALLASAEAVNRRLEVGVADVWMLALPLYHVGGFGVAARAYAAGCRLRCASGRWDADRFGEELRESEATLTSLVPAQVHDLVVRHVRPPSSLRAVVVGGSRLGEAEGREARAMGWPVLQSYGMTETASQIATAPLASLEEEFRAAPLPVLPLWTYRLGEHGCLEVRGPALFEEYLALENGVLHRARPFVAGWFATTDRVAIEEGGLTVLGRADRQVKILGELVDVEAIEAQLRERLPRQVAVCVLPVPDARRGGRLVPFIETATLSQGDPVGALNRTLPGFARLEPPRFVPVLPRTALGKIDTARLREDFASGER